MKNIIKNSYYIPKPTLLPISIAIGITTILISFALFFHKKIYSQYYCLSGSIIMLISITQWIIYINKENKFYTSQVNKSYTICIKWIIFSETCFFCTLLFSLFFIKNWSIPILGGIIHPATTHILIWPKFKSQWPLIINPNNYLFYGPTQYIKPHGIALINTIILSMSGITIYLSEKNLKAKKILYFNINILITILFGIIFIILQYIEYEHAYKKIYLTLNSGIYGSIFYILTGFHGIHVLIGIIILTIIFIYNINTNKFFSKKNNYSNLSLKLSSLYWHFVDIIWIILYIFVYCFH
ncbi:cytochrome c oxidase subunit 3 [Candidatus Legionella polyplacis]|uniref:cytochrome-c oxidase n=1 Tax=Candidatus Legionella polyplacis TaxID=2005262 RepID=A0ABZ2GWJ9_9GAMM